MVPRAWDLCASSGQRKAAFCAEVKEPATGAREMRALNEEIVKLKREIVRKNGALAEAAALLILQKKFRALLEDAEL